MSWRDWPVYSPECRRDVQRLLAKGGSLTAYRANPKYGPGPAKGSWAWRAERLAERIHKVQHVILCQSGTQALVTLLRSYGLGWPPQAARMDPQPSDGEIVTTALTFSATVGAIIHAGFTPVFADVEIPKCTLDLDSMCRMTNTTRTVAFLPVDLFGRQSVFGENPVDACQSVGIRPGAAHGVWSFNGRKNVPAGEGGAIFTRDAVIARRARDLLNHAENFGTDFVGENGHMPEVTACLVYHGLKDVKQRNRHRQQAANRLNRYLRSSWVNHRFELPDPRDHALYAYPLILDKGMPEVARRLQQRGVACQPGYIQPPLHHYPAFKDFRRDALPNTESLSQDRLLLFPQITPTVTNEEVDQLGEAILKALT